MRLTCPNCSAQYEVPDEVIPEEGRDVQCSSCEHTWFQAKYPADVAAEPVSTKLEEPVEPEPETVPQAAPQDVVERPAEKKPATAKGSVVDPAVASILQEEAAREADLRAQEGENLESQPDLALETAPEPESEVKDTGSVTTETAADAGQKDVLPDVDAINSSLRSDEPTADEDTNQPAPRKSGGFVRGFALILIIGVVLYLVYGNARQISEAVPQADPVLSSYVSLVDQARLWLESQAGSGASQN